MKKFEDKTLLILGSNVMAPELADYARANGARTIVADYYDADRSAAKRKADEAVLLSTADTEALKALCLEKHVDGVFSGIMEFNLLQAEKVSRELGLRFYFDRHQWDLIENKGSFRKLCEKFGVPCPKTYYSGPWQEAGAAAEEVPAFPAVVKPVDCAASLGVHICMNREEVRRAIPEAGEKSGSGNIIIEEFVRGYEFTAHYTVCRGKAAFACMDNRYPVAVHEGNVTTIPVARVFPSLFTDRFREQVDDRMVRLCEGIGLEYAVIFIQGMYDPDADCFHIFEAGLRSAAEAPCRFMQQVTGQNHYLMLADYILNGASDYDLSREKPDMDGRCCGIVSFATPGGVVGRVSGLEEAVAATPSVSAFELRYPEGSTAPDGDTLRQLMIRFVMNCPDREAMKRDVAYLNSHVEAFDAEGRNMLVKFDPERLDSWL